MVSTKPTQQQQIIEATWAAYPADGDGWHLVHEALKQEMRLFAKAIDVLAEQLADGKSLEQWQVEGVKTFWLQYCNNVISHHDHEEDFFFPWLATKINLPTKVTADHKVILEDQRQITALVDQLCSSAPTTDNQTAVLQIKSNFAPYKAEMLEHFEEEERDVVPLMRKTFTRKEYAAVTQKMVAKMGPYEAASLVYYLPEDERRAFMNREGIPWFIQSLLILPRTRKYGKLFVDPLEHVIAGSPPPPTKKGLLAILGLNLGRTAATAA